MGTCAECHKNAMGQGVSHRREEEAGWLAPNAREHLHVVHKPPDFGFAPLDGEDVVVKGKVDGGAAIGYVGVHALNAVVPARDGGIVSAAGEYFWR